jgi:hypothetical protein
MEELLFHKRDSSWQIRAVEEMASNRTRTASDDKTIEILGRAREELSKLDLS